MKIKNYIEQLLEQVADECNVKQIILEVKGEKSVYSFDTLRRRNIGADENYALFSLVFSGDIIKDMEKVRDFVNSGLKDRSDSGIKVRQPLQSMTINLK